MAEVLAAEVQTPHWPLSGKASSTDVESQTARGCANDEYYEAMILQGVFFSLVFAGLAMGRRAVRRASELAMRLEADGVLIFHS